MRYRKNDRSRTYSVRALDDGRAELWVVAEERGRVARSRKLVTFEPSDDRDAFLEDVERTLRLGGWSPA
jgi:hypothetical protein